jgi:hypothetical protein
VAAAWSTRAMRGGRRAQAALGILLAAGMFGASVSPARAGTEPRSLDLAAVARPVADLYPGGSGAAQFTVGNPNPFPVRLLSLSFGKVNSSNPAACPPGVLSARPVRLRGVVPAGATAVAEEAPRAFRLARWAPDGCQGVTFTAAATVVGAIVDDGDGDGDGDGGAGATAGGGTSAGTGLASVTGPARPGAGAAAVNVPGALALSIPGAAAASVPGAAAASVPGAAAASVPRALAQTGAPVLPLTAGGVALALAGGAVVRLAARRRKAGRPVA